MVRHAIGQESFVSVRHANHRDTMASIHSFFHCMIVGSSTPKSVELPSITKLLYLRLTLAIGGLCVQAGRLPTLANAGPYKAATVRWAINVMHCVQLRGSGVG